MKVDFTEEQLNRILECLDFTVQQGGLEVAEQLLPIKEKIDESLDTQSEED